MIRKLFWTGVVLPLLTAPLVLLLAHSALAAPDDSGSADGLLVRGGLILLGFALGVFGHWLKVKIDLHNAPQKALLALQGERAIDAGGEAIEHVTNAIKKSWGAAADLLEFMQDLEGWRLKNYQFLPAGFDAEWFQAIHLLKKIRRNEDLMARDDLPGGLHTKLNEDAVQWETEVSACLKGARQSLEKKFGQSK